MTNEQTPLRGPQQRWNGLPIATRVAVCAMLSQACWSCMPDPPPITHEAIRQAVGVWINDSKEKKKVLVISDEMTVIYTDNDHTLGGITLAGNYDGTSTFRGFRDEEVTPGEIKTKLVVSKDRQKLTLSPGVFSNLHLTESYSRLDPQTLKK